MIKAGLAKSEKSLEILALIEILVFESVPEEKIITAREEVKRALNHIENLKKRPLIF